MKNHHLFWTHEILEDVNVHDDDAGLIEHIADKNINLGVEILVSVEGIVLFGLILSELIVEGNP